MRVLCLINSHYILIFENVNKCKKDDAIKNYKTRLKFYRKFTSDISES